MSIDRATPSTAIYERDSYAPQQCFLWLFLGVIAVAQFAVQMMLLTRGVAHITTLVTIDDTYYYLQTAWNLATFGSTTFDGLNSTNGVQFLWFWVLTGLAIVVSTKEAFLYGTVILCALLNVLCYGLIGLIARETKRPLLILGLALFWSLQTFYVKKYLFGMENSLHAFIFWCIVWQFVRFVRLIEEGKTPNLWGLTALLLLNGWARLDSALFSAIFYGYALVLWSRQSDTLSTFVTRNGRTLLGTSLFAGGGFVLQMVSFRVMGGSFLPVSALVKAIGVTRGWQPDSLESLTKYLRLSFPPEIIGSGSPIILVVIIGIFVPIAPLILLRRTRTTEGTASLLHLWLCFILGYGIYHAVVLLSGADYQGYFTWYRSPLYIFWILGFSLILSSVLEPLLYKQSAVITKRATLLTFALVALLSGARYIGSELNQSDVPTNLYSVRYESAQWLQANYPPETIFAAWNAGQLGYFSEHSVVNLDGLINSADYYHDVLAGDKPLIGYLREQGVSYIVDYEDNPLTRSLQIVHEFPQAGKRKLKIWRVE